LLNIYCQDKTIRYASLDELAIKYGLAIKDSKIKEYWDNRVETEDIPYEELAAYLNNDIYVTHEIFKKQLIEADTKGILPLIKTQMEALLATTEMEYNGMYFEAAQAETDSIVISNVMDMRKALLDTEMKKHFLMIIYHLLRLIKTCLYSYLEGY